MKIGRLEIKWAPPTHVGISMKKELWDGIQKLAKDFQKIEPEVLKEALTLYRWVKEEWAEGRKLVTLDKRGRVVTTILDHEDEKKEG